MSAQADLFPAQPQPPAFVPGATAPFLVGKTMWRLFAAENADAPAGLRFTWRAEWRDRAGIWREQREWPTYNINNGMTHGLPLGVLKAGNSFCSRYADYMAVPADARERAERRIAEHLASAAP